MDFRLTARIGEYNTSSHFDCVNGPFGVDCIDSLSDIPVEKVITHPQHTAYQDDIALLRLSTIVKYTGECGSA